MSRFPGDRGTVPPRKREEALELFRRTAPKPNGFGISTCDMAQYAGQLAPVVYGSSVGPLLFALNANSANGVRVGEARMSVTAGATANTYFVDTALYIWRPRQAQEFVMIPGTYARFNCITTGAMLAERVSATLPTTERLFMGLAIVESATIAGPTITAVSSTTTGTLASLIHVASPQGLKQNFTRNEFAAVFSNDIPMVSYLPEEIAALL